MGISDSSWIIEDAELNKERLIFFFRPLLLAGNWTLSGPVSRCTWPRFCPADRRVRSQRSVFMFAHPFVADHVVVVARRGRSTRLDRKSERTAFYFPHHSKKQTANRADRAYGRSLNFLETVTNPRYMQLELSQSRIHEH